eukprot:maker-scaffold874_size86240-snap-gene-0.12 protein:Tk04007 transcript:maker-scaffold874_size86240-snap-gene-0.12-mRNA-1 annotation:"hypothetical protein CGI_10015778"
MERLKDELSLSEVEDLDAMDDLPSPINVEDILGRPGELSDEDETDTVAKDEMVQVKIELVEQNDQTKILCLVRNCGRKFVTNINEDQAMFRFPVQHQTQSRVWIEILGLKNPDDLSSWTMDDDYFVCGLHFTGGVCSKIIGHPSFIPTRFPPGVQPYNVVILPPLDPQSALRPADFHEPIATPTFKAEITFDLESDSDIDEPFAKVPIPPNRNARCEALAMEKWSQLPTQGDVLRAVVVTLGQNGSTLGVKSIVEHIFQLWNKVKCPPIPVKAIFTRIAKLVTSLPGLKSTDILGARKAEFANLFDVACRAEERTSAFNYEFYGDQLSTRRMFFTCTGVILKPALPPGRVKALIKELKDITLPTWLQLPTTKEVLEVVEKTPFTARTLAKIIRGLWKRARCYPCNLNHVVEKIKAIQNINQSGPNGTTELFDIAWEKSLRPADFNDVFYEDQKGLRRMFLTPLDISSTLLSKPTGRSSMRERDEVMKENELYRLILCEQDRLVEPKKPEYQLKAELNRLANRNKRYRDIIAFYRENTTNPSKTHKVMGVLHQKLLEAQKVIRQYELESTISEMILVAKKNLQEANSIRERDEVMKENELYRLILCEQDRLVEPNKPEYQLMAELNHLANRNKRYRDIIAFYRENTTNPSKTHKVMGVLHQKLLEAQKVIRQYELESTISEMILVAKKNLQEANSIVRCKAILTQLLVDMTEREAKDRGETWTSEQRLEEDALLDVYEAEVLDPLKDYELMTCKPLWEDSAFECSDCHLKFLTQGKLDDHLVLYCTVRRCCHVCDLKVSPKDFDHHLKGHNQKYDLNSPLTCDECQVQVLGLEAMQSHVKDHHSNQAFCICCRKMLPKRSLAYHWQRKSMNEARRLPDRMICPFCGKMSPKRHGNIFLPNQSTHVCDEVARDMLEDENVRKFLCQECGERFLTQAKYDSHMGLVHGQGLRVCHICSRSLLKGKYKEHLFTHTRIRPFKCPKCDLTARSKSVITVHLKGVHGVARYANDAIKINPVEFRKRQKFFKNIKAGIKEFIEPLDQIPGKYVGKDPKTFNYKRRGMNAAKGRSLQ